MASTFTNKGNQWIYLSYVGKDGIRHKTNTGYRWSNIGERRQAQRLAEAKTLEEKTQARADVSGRFEEWVPVWIETKYNDLKSKRAYRARWRNIERYLNDIGVQNPVQVTREHVMGYVQWRKDHGGERNTALGEIKSLSMVLSEAVLRKHCQTNVAANLRMKHDKSKEKPAWTDDEILKVDTALKADPYGWMRTTFLLGRFQALRIAQCSIPLDCIDLARGRFNYPDWLVKLDKGFSQTIDPRLVPTLVELIEHRRTTGHRTLCDVPQLCSVEWRRFLDGLGLPHLSHHGLRVTWISKAAISGIPEAVARKFANHSSKAVHRIYQRVSADDVAGFLEKLKA